MRSLRPSPSTLHPSFLMCRPTYYTIAYEINPWMSLKRQVDGARARLQWERLYSLLTRRLGVRVRCLPPQRGVPDLVFTANAGLVHGRTIIRSNFRHPELEREEPVIERYFKRSGFRVVHLNPRYHFEGEGDALWVDETLVFGFRFRSEAPIHEELARLLGREGLPVELSDRRFYHLDTCFCPLDPDTALPFPPAFYPYRPPPLDPCFCPLGADPALWSPQAFARYGRRVLERLVPHLVDVSEADAARFACNAIPIGRAVVMQAGASAALRRRMSHRRFEAHAVDLSEFLKAGGSAKCLVLRLSGHP